MGLRSGISKAMNDDLSKNFIVDEVYKALSQMHPTKAIGLDGMPLAFFQHHWHIIGESIAQAVFATLHYVTEHIFKIGNAEESTKFCVIAWSIWGRQNKLLYENLHIHSRVAIEKALSLLNAYKDYGTPTSSRTRVAWTPPPTGYLKLNVNRVVFFNIQHTDIGFVLKDSIGYNHQRTSYFKS